MSEKMTGVQRKPDEIFESLRSSGKGPTQPRKGGQVQWYSTVILHFGSMFCPPMY